MYLGKKDMKGFRLVEHTRFYLDYLEKHIDHVRKAFNIFYEKCNGEIDVDWKKLQEDVKVHDISKFSKDEFTLYREFFYPLEEKHRTKKVEYYFNEAVAHHKRVNTHHHESLIDDMDIYHMVIDWMAMSMKFGGSPQEYYEQNIDKIELQEDEIEVLEKVFKLIK